MIAIIDYGVGNLFSLQCSLHAVGAEAVITSDAATVERADGVILPGVGAFADAAAKLHRTGLDEAVKARARAGKKLMGICLGMQLLFGESHEYGRHSGLGLIPGSIRPISETIPKGLKIPHMGWNALCIANPAHPLFREIREGDCVYFVHSYSAVDCDEYVLAAAEYGARLTAAVAKDNILGCQFHPEKSGDVGLSILKAFCKL
ncbi:MAG: imidazole glycerol phosphate synthase subunit HisH [Christensenellales bacterium]|jgi:glutamine amidotransferase